MGPPPPNHNRGPAVLGVIWSLFPIAMAVVVLRFFVRYRIHQIGLDDWLMLVAWLCWAGSCIPATLVILAGVGRHADYLTIDQLIFIAYVVPISQVLGLMSSAFAKASIAILLQRLLGPGNKNVKYIIWVTTGIFVAMSIVTSLMAFLNCSPPSANWDLTNPHAIDSCIPSIVSTAINVTHGALSSIQDFVLATISVYIVWNLKINLKQKISLGVLLLVAAFGGIANIVKCVYLPEITQTMDRTYVLTDPYIWVFIESSLNIICGTIPTLKPLYDWFTKRKPLQSKKDAYGSSANRLWSKKSSSRYTATAASDSMIGNLTARSSPSESQFDLNEYLPIQKVELNYIGNTN